MNIDEAIKKRYANERTSEIAKDLGLTYSQVTYRAYKYGLKKSIKFFESEKSGRSNFIQSGKAFRFKKGNIPHNKGKKMSDETYAKVKKTMFKKGNKPHNTKDKNFISWRKDSSGRSYAYYKIKDGVWSLFHRKIYEDQYGKIPEGYIVYFKDGNTKNLHIENLGIKTMSQNMLNNTYVYYPKELKEVIRLNNKLKKKLKK